MTSAQGFDGWVEICFGGKHFAMNGKAYDTDPLIDKAVATFDPNFHEPPAVIGHPKHDDPAYGLVQAVKTETRDGKKVLLAKFKNVEPEFAEMVKAGRFPKRSAGFYPDGRLRHVGFLGATPPAIKGLKNIAFGDGDNAIAFEFAEPAPWTWQAITSVFRKLREYFIEKEGAEKADAIIPEWNIQDVDEEAQRASQPTIEEDSAMKFSEFFNVVNLFKKLGGKDEEIDMIVPATTGPGDGASFSEADVETAKKQAAEEAEARVRAEFAESHKTEAKKQRDADIATWVEGKVSAGSIPPAIRDGGLVAFMQGLPDDAIQFAEGQEKQSGLDWFKGFLDTLGESPLFAEIATKGAAGKRNTEAEAEYKLGKEIGERANR
ncbi:hypothetical protein DSCW_08740 [Desulfosarcina widdelii]|uniref:Peptidase n=1 Tax=Desulfosarcina widdelii TaxID=947919 RepID=A0A5K7ZAG4_9BACT|nr:hypothetical protein [Desulfosarcina widdelii]BBO73457.1 hypothetical protein DSCW_08740 [Desulfosarcina widdelii]